MWGNYSVCPSVELAMDLTQPYEILFNIYSFFNQYEHNFYFYPFYFYCIDYYSALWFRVKRRVKANVRLLHDSVPYNQDGGVFPLSVCCRYPRGKNNKRKNACRERPWGLNKRINPFRSLVCDLLSHAWQLRAQWSSACVN